MRLISNLFFRNNNSTREATKIFNSFERKSTEIKSIGPINITPDVRRRNYRDFRNSVRRPVTSFSPVAISFDHDVRIAEKRRRRRRRRENLVSR